MTEYVPYPRERVQLPEDGKVTGSYVLMFQGDGRLYANTEDAAVNNDEPAVWYRGRRYLVNVHMRRNDAGEITVTSDPYVKSSDNWSPATPTALAAILDALKAHAGSLWTPERDGEGIDADAQQNLNRLEGEERDLRNRLDETMKQIHTQYRRMDRG
jgi:hypothetical protein